MITARSFLIGNGVKNKLCVGRASLVEVGQNTSMDLEWDTIINQ